MNSPKAMKELRDMVAEIFTKKMKFMEPFDLKVEHYDEKAVRVRFDMNDQLIGNMAQHILHGGVSASVLDAIGGMVAIAATCAKEQHTTREQQLTHIAKAATINLRIDFVRPGRGKYFIGTAELVRCGNKIVVMRSELRNDQDILICTGMANYMVGS